MFVKGALKTGEYFDSVTLMIAARELASRPGVSDAAVVMGTADNKSILSASGLLCPEVASAGDADLVVCVKAADAAAAAAALAAAESLLKNVRKSSRHPGRYEPKSLENALQILPGANMAMISVAGKYAGDVAMSALRRGLHVMLFSDNVPLETEVQLKTFARDRGLLVMGPDCGTAIINGVPLAFANAVNRGPIGIVAAAGTGLQEVSCIISNAGSGVSQAIGTGGRDVKEAVGGIMFLEGLRSLAEDAATEVILLVSKPPHPKVLEKIGAAVKDLSKPVVAAFLGADPRSLAGYNMSAAPTLEEAALLAAALAGGRSAGDCRDDLRRRDQELAGIAAEAAVKAKAGQKYVRGLFSGGTFCSEAQLIFGALPGGVYSNAPLPPAQPLPDAWKSRAHSFVDLGEDAFTVGRPHPMIDFSLRNRRILEEAKDPEVAAILLDVVLGYGSNPEPAGELAPAISEAKAVAEGQGRRLALLCSVTGTEEDPQVRSAVEKRLKEAGAVVLPSNAAACKVAAGIARKLDR